MPIIMVNIIKGEVSTDEKKLMMQNMTHAIASATPYQPQDIRIIIQELEHDHYSVAGQTQGTH